MRVCGVRRELHFSVSQGASSASENVEQQHYTKTWQVDASPLLQGDGGETDVTKLSPIVRGTTAELEARHTQLDEILVGLLNEATANKGQPPASGSVTLTSQRVTQSQAPQVKQYTETSTLLKTAQSERQVRESRDHYHQQQQRPRAPIDDASVGRPQQQPQQQQRPYVSDSEEPAAWLDDQRQKLRAGRRPGWRERSARDRQLVSELRSAQSWRTRHARTHSESEMAPPAAADGYEVRPGRYVSGVERRPYTSQQTMYTFGVSPQRTGSLDLVHGPDPPPRTDSSRDAMARQRLAQGT